jgi:hypothetical protein
MADQVAPTSGQCPLSVHVRFAFNSEAATRQT